MNSTPDRIGVNDDGSLDEIVLTGTAHLESSVFDWRTLISGLRSI